MSNAPARRVLVQVSCPACKTQHSLEMSRDYRDKALDDGKIELYCIRSDATWMMSLAEKRSGSEE